MQSTVEILQDVQTLLEFLGDLRVSLLEVGEPNFDSLDIAGEILEVGVYELVE